MSTGLLARGNAVEYLYDGLDEAFPKVDPGHEPLGSLVLVQIRQPKTVTRGGIVIPQEARSTDHYNTQVAKVIAVGPLAYHNRDTLAPWPEGAWCKPGDIVRVPKYQGDRIAVPFNRIEWEEGDKGRKEKLTVKDEAVFVLFKDLAIIAKITGDPLKIRAFLDN